MLGYTVSVKNNKIFISHTSEPLEVLERKLDKDVVDGTDIVDTKLFSEKLGEIILEEYGPSPEKKPLNFLIEPQDVILSFLTNNKDVDDLMEQAQEKLAQTGLTSDDVYFSYQKIAPFVYQFIAIRKKKLEKYLEVAGNLGFELGSVVPWTMLLPKTVSDSGKAGIFVVEKYMPETIAFFELGGIYYKDEMSKKDFGSLMEELSVYKEDGDGKNIYVWGDSKIDFGEKYSVNKIDVENTHDLFNDYYNEKIKISQINLLNLLPLPVEQKQPRAMVYVASTVLTLFILGGVFYGISQISTENPTEEINVLSEQGKIQVENQEPKQEQAEEQSAEQNEEEDTTEEDSEADESAVDLKREYLTVKVLNSTNTMGLAGDTTTFLEDLGYDALDPDDAEGQTRESTLIQFAEDYNTYEEMLVEDLSEMYSDIKVQNNLEADLNYNALITVGTDRVE